MSEILRHEQPKKLEDYLKTLNLTRVWLTETIKPLHKDVLDLTKKLEQKAGEDGSIETMPSLILARKKLFEAVSQAEEKFPLLKWNPTQDPEFSIYLNTMGYKKNEFDLVPQIRSEFSTFDFVQYLERLTKAQSVISTIRGR